MINYSIGHHKEHFCEIILEFGLVVQEEMPYKDILYLELWWPFHSALQNHLCNFGRGHYEE